MNKRHYEHTLPNIRGSLSNTYTGRRSVPVNNVTMYQDTHIPIDIRYLYRERVHEYIDAWLLHS